MCRFLTYLAFGTILISTFANSGCALLAFAKQGQYRCSISGEPDPVTSDDYFNRAVKHAEMSKTDFTGDFDECAWAALNESLRLNPDNYNALLMRSFGNYQKKQYDLALTDVEKVIKLEPQKVDGYYRRGNIYEKMGLIDKALTDQTKAIELATEEYPWREFLYSTRGDLYFKKGDNQAALNDYSEAIRIKPDRKEFYAKRAKVYRKLNNNASAEADEAKAQENNSTEISKATIADKNPSANKTISGGVVNSKALNLVQPAYPPTAKAVRAAGTVNVQVTIDENGKVISASAVSGHPLLKAAAESAAKASTFNPTKLKGEAIKVTGIIVYNFTAE